MDKAQYVVSLARELVARGVLRGEAAARAQATADAITSWDSVVQSPSVRREVQRWLEAAVADPGPQRTPVAYFLLQTLY